MSWKYSHAPNQTRFARLKKYVIEKKFSTTYEINLKYCINWKLSQGIKQFKSEFRNQWLHERQGRDKSKIYP